MSLRVVHVVFITASALLAVFVAGWAATEYNADQGLGYGIASGLGLASAAGLGAYGAAFLRKTRGIS